jgi:hypothetical protein
MPSLSGRPDERTSARLTAGPPMSETRNSGSAVEAAELTMPL